jgi:hypothetical protein
MKLHASYVAILGFIYCLNRCLCSWSYTGSNLLALPHPSSLPQTMCLSLSNNSCFYWCSLLLLIHNFVDATCGCWGFIYGPTIVSLFLALFDIDWNCTGQARALLLVLLLHAIILLMLFSCCLSLSEIVTMSFSDVLVACNFSCIC